MVKVWWDKFVFLSCCFEPFLHRRNDIFNICGNSFLHRTKGFSKYVAKVCWERMMCIPLSSCFGPVLHRTNGFLKYVAKIKWMYNIYMYVAQICWERMMCIPLSSCFGPLMHRANGLQEFCCNLFTWKPRCYKSLLAKTTETLLETLHNIWLLILGWVGGRFPCCVCSYF